jgi:hypothetical protein
MIMSLQDCQEKNIPTQAINGPFFRPQNNRARLGNTVRLNSPIIAVAEKPTVLQSNSADDGTWPETWYGAMLLPQAIYIVNAAIKWVSQSAFRSRRR